MKPVKDMTDREVLDALQNGDDPVSRVRALLAQTIGQVEQAEAQRVKPTGMERRRFELEAARKITAIFVPIS